MLKPKKIRIIKRVSGVIEPANQKTETVAPTVPPVARSERDVARQVSAWVTDWREQKRRQVSASAGFFGQ